MTASPPPNGGLDVESWGDPEDPIVLLIGAPEHLSGDWRRSVRALVEAGRHVMLAADFDEADDSSAALRRLLTELPSRPAIVCSDTTLDAVAPALAVTGPALASCLAVVAEGQEAVSPELEAQLAGVPIQTIARAEAPDAVETENAALLGFLERHAPRDALYYQAGSDPRTLRDALGCFATGVTVVTTLDEAGQPVGLTANSFSSVSLDPPLILFCLARSSTNVDRFRQAEHFAINVLHIGQQPTSGVFARSQADRFQDVAWETWDTGAPILSGALASFECGTEQIVEAGDHLIIIGRVRRARFEPRRDPLLYFRGKYRRLHFS
ncbi:MULTISPECIES: flavin reductase family protein [Brevundimonas]|uniref:flavin reductase family protein n=1 Tax=Brevundimonas TaxID=41275 RepID=UPI0025BCE7DE|nr:MULTISPECIES: flavin reductase family protein [Brevundimonas]